MLVHLLILSVVRRRARRTRRRAAGGLRPCDLPFSSPVGSNRGNALHNPLSICRCHSSHTTKSSPLSSLLFSCPRASVSFFSVSLILCRRLP
ncbi:hypothetical protein HYPSUDRAFT_378537 [Hypholoma sublateritium FD-334 SS-4]|uniref:Uncharacterized protein n=1 Tax=Hypholoma sublateritium (strain FD-334 SS-4) TaxID=945553 RepID=A0A0D2PB22_HYPSF|nr:hypothetical protein HYPSUDRAFT_378537 [Hypholoma sublateritium FD-334 SS-4]